MEEIQQNYSRGAGDPEATVVQPRFDALEAQTAQPVVPLRRAAAWRRLPVALVLVSALFGGLISVAAYRLYQRAARSHAAPPAATAQPQTAPSPELTAAAPPAQDATKTKATRDTAPADELKNDATKDEPAKNESAKNEAAKNEAAQTATDETAAHERGDEAASRAAARAATAPRIERRAPSQADEEEARAPHRRGGDETERARRDQQGARRVDVITSPTAAEPIWQGRRRGDDEGNAQTPDWREGRRGRRVKGRNIDRIRDIFGAPPPA